MRLRHDLAAYSPVRLTDLASAAAFARGGEREHQRLGDLLKSRYAAEHVVLVDSGTHALQLAVRHALRMHPADAPVALPAFVCFDVATAAVAVGRRVALYDVDPETLAPDVESLQGVLRRGARVAVIAPVYGIPVDWARLEDIARPLGATLIEDAAQGHGASWRGQPLGSIGGLSVLSFGRGKGWTGGQGGALLLRQHLLPADERLEPPAGDVTNALALGVQWLLGRPSIYGLPRSLPWLRLGETHYREPSKVRQLAPSAARAIVRSDPAALLEAEARRRRAADLLSRARGRAQHIRVGDEGIPGYLRLPMLVDGGMHALPADAERFGIAPSYPIPLSELPALQPLLVDRRATYPGATRLARDLITMPTHSRLSASAVSYAARLFD